MTSADTIGCRLALAREEDGNREMGDRRQVFGLVINCKLLIHPKGGFFPIFTFRHPGSPVLDKKDKKRRIDIEESAFVFVATYADPLGASQFGSSLFAALF
jgi:hypothetical protein